MAEVPHDKLRVNPVTLVATPSQLMQAIPLSDRGRLTILNARKDIANIIDGLDRRWLVVVGPCSIHDSVSAIDYAHRLKSLSLDLSDQLLIVMRVYFEKPRTTVGWKGHINDPHMDGSSEINEGLISARRILSTLANLGLPAGCEFLDTVTPLYISDMVAWAAIGARTVECQLHREMASGLSMPVGFKNSTSGDTTVAIEAMVTAASPHSFLSMTHEGQPAVIHSVGNTQTHIVLRGGKSGPNFEVAHVTAVLVSQRNHGINKRVMIDCSHGNSDKNYRNQSQVLDAVINDYTEGDKVLGLMIESNIEDGRQDIPSKENMTGKKSVIERLKYGQSVTDACLGWEQTEAMLRRLAQKLR